MLIKATSATAALGFALAGMTTRSMNKIRLLQTMGRLCIAGISFAVLAGTASASYITMKPNGTSTVTGQWIVTIAAESPSVWSYSISADPDSLPSSNAVEFEVDFCYLQEHWGGSCQPLKIEGTASTDASWLVLRNGPFVHAVNGTAAPLSSAGNNTLSGLLSMTTEAPYVGIHFFLAESLNGPNWIGSGSFLIADPDAPLPPRPVPEPSVFAMLGLGLAGIALTRRRKHLR